MTLCVDSLRVPLFLLLGLLVPQVLNELAPVLPELMGGSASRRRDCHYAAPPSSFSRCSNRGCGGDVSKITELLPKVRPT